MHSSPQPPEIRFTVFSSADEEDVAQLLAHAFSTREPIGIAVGITAEEFASTSLAEPPPASSPNQKCPLVGNLRTSSTISSAHLAD